MNVQVHKTQIHKLEILIIRIKLQFFSSRFSKFTTQSSFSYHQFLNYFYFIWGPLSSVDKNYEVWTFMSNWNRIVEMNELELCYIFADFAELEFSTFSSYLFVN